MRPRLKRVRTSGGLFTKTAMNLRFHSEIFILAFMKVVLPVKVKWPVSLTQLLSLQLKDLPTAFSLDCFRRKRIGVD